MFCEGLFRTTGLIDGSILRDNVAGFSSPTAFVTTAREPYNAVPTLAWHCSEIVIIVQSLALVNSEKSDERRTRQSDGRH
jgi:hypothetical protein